MNVLGWLLVTALAFEPIQWASQAQGEAFRYDPLPMLMSGGWGSGKTYAGCLKGLWLSTAFPKNRGLIVRSVGKELRATTMQTFYKITEPALYARGRRNDQEGRCVLNNGSEILFQHLENPNVQGIIRGLEINWFLIDQAEEDPEHMEEIFDRLLGRLSRWDIATVPQALIDLEQAQGRAWQWRNPATGKPMPPPYAMMACNPDTEPHWLYRRFHPESADHQRTYKARGYKLFDIATADNQFLPQSNKDALLAGDEAFVARNYYGRWGFASGTIHVVPKESLIVGHAALPEWFRQTCTLSRTLDYGDSSPTCCLWWAVDRNGNVFCIREYYLPNALISTHRRNITDLSVHETYAQNLADPSMFHQMPQKSGGRWAYSDEYADCTNQPRETAIFWTPADNNELGTRNRINEYLRVDPDRIHPITHTRGAPRLFFVTVSDDYPQGCYHVLRELRSQRRVQIGTDLGKAIFSDERNPEIPDHAYDNLRYEIASRPGAPPEPRQALEGTFTAKRDELVKFRKQMEGRR